MRKLERWRWQLLWMLFATLTEGGLIYGLMPASFVKLVLLFLLDIVLIVTCLLMALGFVTHWRRKSKQSTTGV